MGHAVSRIKRTLALCLAIAGTPSIALAWGPHSEITAAAMQALAPDSALVRRLGPDAQKLPQYAWMADWRRTLRQEADQWFYVDDYLLFPGMPNHVEHICPAVRATYAPFFRRALQALRTETPANAARWVGSLLHFTEDTGSPPHAAEVLGDIHSKMENWVDARAITIAGYRPERLGATDEEALAGFLRRMDGLIAYSRNRFERARPHVVAGDRMATEPIVLESALETARVVADLLETLGPLAEQPQPGTVRLSGMISTAPVAGIAKVPAKVVLLGTTYSTLADAGGHYEFHQLPPGAYTLAVFGPGSAVATAEVTLTAGHLTTRNVPLPAGPLGAGLVRNGAMTLRWAAPERPDAWLAGPKGTWTGEFLPLEPGRAYRLVIDWREGASGQVAVRWTPSMAYGAKSLESKALGPGDTELAFTGSESARFAQILIRGKGSPADLCRSVSVVPDATQGALRDPGL
jgi:hypothetical protein